MVLLGRWLDLMILEVFSNLLFYDSFLLGKVPISHSCPPSPEREWRVGLPLPSLKPAQASKGLQEEGGRTYLWLPRQTSSQMVSSEYLCNKEGCQGGKK